MTINLNSSSLEYAAIIHRRFPKALFQALSDGVKGDVLDIGCGSGVILKTMEKLRLKVIGIDTSRSAINLCQNLSRDLPINHEFYQCDIRNFNVEKNRYAAIIAMSSLVALKRKELISILDKMKTGLKPWGVIYIEVFTVRDPIYTEPVKYLPEGESTFFHPQWNSFIYLFKPGELLYRFREFEILDYKEVYNTDFYPFKHKHHEARLCCRKPKY